MGAFQYGKDIRKMSVEIQMEDSFRFLSNIRDYLWRWSTYFGQKIPTEMFCSSFDKRTGSLT